jgi:prepilin signal peptidase PulO-like enzyme (type II secretory pathway)
VYLCPIACASGPLVSLHLQCSYLRHSHSASLPHLRPLRLVHNLLPYAFSVLYSFPLIRSTSSLFSSFCFYPFLSLFDTHSTNLHSLYLLVFVQWNPVEYSVSNFLHSLSIVSLFYLFLIQSLPSRPHLLCLPFIPPLGSISLACPHYDPAICTQLQAFGPNSTRATLHS